MPELLGQLRSYAWGSHTALAALCQRPAPTSHPEAELWFGAHPQSPSLLVPADGSGAASVALDAVIEKNPVAELGATVAQSSGSALPFLVKILAAEEPLSIQAHPSMTQAQLGFAAEEAAGLDRDAADRNYRDQSHKPEILVALTPFAALAGFRPPLETVAFLDALDVPGLRPFRHLLAGQMDETGIRAVFTTFLTLPTALLDTLVPETVAACVRYLELAGAKGRWYRETKAIVQIGERYSADPGILAALLLNNVELEPGEAIFMAAGSLHAYLYGLGVEVMANSDNVLRGGLTTKHVDVPELLKVVDFEPTTDPIVSPVEETSGTGELNYPVPVEDFRLSSLRFVDEHDTVELQSAGPQIILCIDGTVNVRTDTEDYELTSGRAGWVPATATTIILHGSPQARVFRVQSGLPACSLSSV